MALQITKQSHDYFRWHDSGDIFSKAYLMLMAKVIQATPTTRHWIPTKELSLITQHRLLLVSLPNATFRYSTTQLANEHNGLNSKRTSLPIAHVSNINHYGSPDSIHRIAQQGGLLCLAKHRVKKGKGQACGPCRACWNKNIKIIVYPLH